MREFDIAAGWTTHVKEIRELHCFSPHSVLYRQVSEPPVSFLPTMVSFQDRSYIDALDEYGCLVVLSNGPPLEGTSWRGVNLPKEATGEKRQRQCLRNVLRPTGSDSCTLGLHMVINTPLHGYYMPDFIIGAVATLMVGNMKTKLDEGVGRWADGGWKERFESGPNAEDYAALQQRIQNVLACSGT